MDIMEDFNRTVDHIDASLSESADDREIRRLSGYSRAMFSRVLSIFTGMTLSEYIRGRRLTEAAFDLHSSEERVVGVALRHGFGSPDSFAAASKEFHSRTPLRGQGREALSGHVQTAAGAQRQGRRRGEGQHPEKAHLHSGGSHAGSHRELGVPGDKSATWCAPDFEVYGPGDMHADGYEMELWVPIERT